MTTQTKKMSATALSEVDCNWVSLVKRGANRQPIKIHKSEDGNTSMGQKTLDLAGIGAKALKSDTPSNPVVVAAIVTKGEGERVSELLAGAEDLELKVVSVKTDEENDCDIIHFVEDANLENAIAYKHDDNVVLLVGGVKESAQKMDFWADSTSFKENIQKTSFFPNLREASYTLVDTIANIVHSGDDGEIAKKTEAEIGAFNQYVQAMVEALPVKVLKSLEGIDFAKPEETVTEDDKGVAAKDESVVADDKSDAAKTEDDAKGEAAKSEGETVVADDKDEAAKTEDDTKGDAAKSEEEAPAWAQSLAQKMDDFNTRLASVEESAQAAVDSAKKAEENTQEAKTLAEKAEGALNTARRTVKGDAEVEEDLPVPDQAFSDDLNDDLREGGIELA